MALFGKKKKVEEKVWVEQGDITIVGVPRESGSQDYFLKTKDGESKAILTYYIMGDVLCVKAQGKGGEMLFTLYDKEGKPFKTGIFGELRSFADKTFIISERSEPRWNGDRYVSDISETLYSYDGKKLCGPFYHIGPYDEAQSVVCEGIISIRETEDKAYFLDKNFKRVDDKVYQTIRSFGETMPGICAVDDKLIDHEGYIGAGAGHEGRAFYDYHLGGCPSWFVTTEDYKGLMSVRKDGKDYFRDMAGNNFEAEEIKTSEGKKFAERAAALYEYAWGRPLEELNEEYFKDEKFVSAVKHHAIKNAIMVYDKSFLNKQPKQLEVIREFLDISFNCGKDNKYVMEDLMRAAKVNAEQARAIVEDVENAMTIIQEKIDGTENQTE